MLYQLNRDPGIRERFGEDEESVLADYELTGEELEAIRKPDIGLLYVLGVNGQLLMHFAAMKGYAWDDYMQAMRNGRAEHGPVRAGVYALVRDTETDTDGGDAR